MKKTLVIICLAISSLSFASQKYNWFNGKWETVPENSEMKYNTFQGDWSYQPYDAKIEFNPFEGKWEWDSGLNNY